MLSCSIIQHNTYTHKVLTYSTEQYLASSKLLTPDPTPPLHPASVSSSPRNKGVGVHTHSPGGEGVGGLYFGRRQTIGLASDSIIPLRLYCWDALHTACINKLGGLKRTISVYLEIKEYWSEVKDRRLLYFLCTLSHVQPQLVFSRLAVTLFSGIFYLRGSYTLGYSDFHNLMGFTSKKMPNNIL